MIFDRKYSEKSKDWHCFTDDNNEPEPNDSPKLDFRANACNKFRNYRLAIATTFEYSNRNQ